MLAGIFHKPKVLNLPFFLVTETGQVSTTTSGSGGCTFMMSEPAYHNTQDAWRRDRDPQGRRVANNGENAQSDTRTGYSLQQCSPPPHARSHRYIQVQCNKRPAVHGEIG